MKEERKNNALAKINKPLLFVAYSSLFFFGLTDNARGPSYPEILRFFDLSNTQGSFLFASSSFVGFVLSFSSAHWLKKLHLHLALKVGLVQIAISSLLIGLSAQFSSPTALVIASLLQGSGMGMCGVSMNLMVEKASPAHIRRKAFGGLHATYGIASLIAPLLYTQAISLGFSWMHFFYFLAGLGPIIIFLPSGKKEVIYSTNSVSADEVKIPRILLVTLGLCVGMYVASEIVISSRLVLFLEQGLGYSNAKASSFLSLFFLLLMSGRLIVGLVHFKISGPTILYSSLLSTIVFCLIGLGGYPIFLALTGLSMSVFFPAFMDWLADSFPNEFQRVTSTVLSGIGLHLVVMHLGFGKIAQGLGVTKAMSLAPLLAFISLFMLVFATQKVRSLKA